MAKIIGRPELRYTQENQTAITQMLVEFEGNRAGEAPSTLTVVVWGNLAAEVAQKYYEGDRVILEGRLSMKTLTGQDGTKQKKAELVANRVYRLEGNLEKTAVSDKAVSIPTHAVSNTAREVAPPPLQTVGAGYGDPIDDNLDDIPF